MRQGLQRTHLHYLQELCSFLDQSSQKYMEPVMLSAAGKVQLQLVYTDDQIFTSGDSASWLNSELSGIRQLYR